MKNAKYSVLFGLSLFLFLSSTQSLHGQQASVEFEPVKLDTDAGLRGLSVVDENTVWASGGDRTIVHSSDSGKTWSVKKLPAPDKLEFRDVEGFGTKSALVLSAGSPGLVLQTKDGGNSWNEVYRDNAKSIFFDAFGFWDPKNGIAFSDPRNSKLRLITTIDGGASWKKMIESAPAASDNEGGFAASGTCLTTFGDQHVWIGLGGKPLEGETKFARVLYSKDRGRTWNASTSTIPRSESAGIFSLCFLNEKVGFVIGGDYKNPEGKKNNLSLTFDGGKSWRAPKKSFPSGYRSCITAAKLDSSKWVLIATGTNGTDTSVDGGESWQRASNEGFHAIAFVPGKTWGWASGAKGKLAKFRIVTAKSR